MLGALAVGIGFDVAAHNGLVTLAGTALATTTAVCLLASGRLHSRLSRALIALGPILSIALMSRASEWVTIPVVCAITVSFLLAVSFADSNSFASTFPMLGGRFSLVMGHLAFAPGMLTRDPDEIRHDSATRSRVLAVARGLALAIPIVVVIGALLGAADPVFESWFDPPRLLQNLVLVLIGAWVLLGLARAAAAKRPTPVLGGAPTLGTVEVVSVLGALSAVYAAFVISQVVAVAGGAKHVLQTTGLTYAEYARSGFFQLLAAASITLIVLLSVRACADRRRLSVLVGSEVTIVLTLAVVAVAIRRLDLYESAYGLTLLRLASTTTAVWIGVVFLVLAVAVARRASSAQWFGPAVVLSGVLFVGMWAAANPADVVARVNVRRAAHGSALDIGSSFQLAADGVPALVEGSHRLSPQDQQLLRLSLCSREPRERRGAAFNHAEATAERVLENYCDR